ncbi:Rne/Rng family ribonuclease [Synechocystis sp. LKSZ1]|uniref:Rne/Rng family ribonuclease n=1 Tax=Synechocystis sp. LKSZ1 TaxID=3144951 RepID=UPI00336BB8D7
MPKQIIIAEQHQIAAVFWEDQIQELVVATGNQQVGDIYLGLVENVLPGIDAAFVNIGDAERNGFIHVTDLGPLRLKKNSGAITELLAPQQKVLVQVMKEPTGNKGPRLTGNISLPGRYVVLIPNGKGVNLSRRIVSDTERSRLRALAILMKPAGMGMLVRTEAEGKAEEAIIEDLEFLQKQWETIQQQAISARPPALLNRDDDFIQRVLRDMYSADVNRIVADSQAGVKRIKQNLLGWSGGRPPEGVLIDQHREPQSILDYFRINAAIREALKPRVDLPSGGYIIIEPTEALTVIDVNSGSFTRSATSRETVLWTNSEAATEIARQLRLRNIGGVIIVDFIDMDSRRDQLKLLEHFNRCLRADKARPQIAQLSELGLVELTRKRQGKNIYELFGRPCPTCGGLGHLADLPGEREAVALESVTLNLPSTGPRVIEKPILDIAPEPSFDKGFESTENDDEFDLTHHPSYQEQGGANRRRRRRRVPELGKEEAPVKPVLSLPIKTSEPEKEAEPEERKEKRVRERSPRREEAVVERVTVEMTPLEQEIYALMGISPLIRLEQSFKDPKSVIVSVQTPGSSATAETSVEPAPTTVTTPNKVINLTTLEPRSGDRPRSLRQDSPLSETRSIPSPKPKVTLPVPESKPSTIVSPSLDTSPTAEETEEKSGTRRRRRRSSASDS